MFNRRRWRLDRLFHEAAPAILFRKDARARNSLTLRIGATIEQWPVAGAFVISRGAKTSVDLVVVEVDDGAHRGRGEGSPIYYKGETARSCLEQISRLPADFDRALLQHLLPPGAARNAVDCALWEVEASRAGTTVWALAGLNPPQPLVTAMTVSVGTPLEMAEQARRLVERTPLLKLKLAGEGDFERVIAVRREVPDARLIIDANEGWTGRDIARETAALLPFGIELVEQPVRAGSDDLLDGLASPIPLGADESVHDRADLARCTGRYQAINIKLDKTGGLTEALALRAEARALGLKIMVGCMLSTSLGIAPAFLVAQDADWVDLDGALLLARDRKDGLVLHDGRLRVPVTSAPV